MTSPIIPDYLVARARVGVIFEREIASQVAAGDQVMATALIQLRNEVLAAIGPGEEMGGAPIGPGE